MDLIALVLGGRARELPHATVHAASELLAGCGGLAGLARTDVAEIEGRLSALQVPRAPGAARALAASFELGRRALVAASPPPRRLSCSADAAAWGIPRIGSLGHEELWVLPLDGRGRLLGARCVAKGGVHGVGVRAVDPLRIAIRAGATGFVLVHNHPSGDPTPSREDAIFTREIAASSRVVGVPLLDHVVVSGDGFASVPLEDGGEG